MKNALVKLAIAACSAIVVAWMPQYALGARYWDRNGATAGAGGPSPSGTWGPGFANWNANAMGSGATGTWTINEVAYFSAGSDATGAFTVTVSGTQTATGLNIEEGTITFSGGTVNVDGLTSINVASAIVDGANSAWTTDLLWVGNNSVGSLTVQNGGDVNVTNTNATTVFIGQTSTATGTLLVTGSGSTFTTATGGDMVIGNNGSSGTVTVANNGLVDIADLTTIGADGRLNLQGGTFSTRNFSDTSTGTLDLDDGVLEIDGGAFNIGGGTFAFQGNAAGKTVTFRLKNGASGSAGIFETGNLGGIGAGRFELLSGADFTSQLTTIGDNSGSQGSALVDGTGSVWTTADLRVGGAGTGSLTVQNGGDVVATGSLVTVAHNASGTGTLLVTGSGSGFTTTTGDMAIGNNGSNGTATIANGASVDIADLTTIGTAGRLHLQRGTFRTGSFANTLGGTLDLDQGNFEIDGGTFNNGITNFSFQGNAAGRTVFFTLMNEASGASANLEIGQLGGLGAGRFQLLSGSTFSSALTRIGRNGGSSGSALIDGIGSVWTTETMRLGENGAGSIIVQNGGSVIATGSLVTVGHFVNSTGELHVTGNGSDFTMTTGDLVIGNGDGTGTVIVANGGLVDIADLTTIGANGTLNLWDGTFRTGSFTHTLGGTLDFEKGIFEIDGGTFNNGVTNFAFQGDASGKTVTFRLTNGATGASDELRVGSSGNIGAGAFELKSGSTFSSTLARIALQGASSGSALVDGAGSVWTTGAMRVGEGGVGSLTVQNGGDVNVTDTNSTSVRVGDNAVGTGTLLVTGSGSKLTTATGGDMVIGNNGSTGTVTVANNGLVDIADRTTIGAVGRLNLQGGTFRTGSFTHTLGGTIDFDDGTLEIDGGAFNNGVSAFSFQGDAAGKTVTFRLTNGATGASTELRVGNTGPFGSGRFELLDGSTFSSTLARIATQANSSGSALVDAGSVWTTGAMRVGEGGVGSLTVQNDGDVNVTDTNSTSVRVGDNAVGTGTLLVTGSGSTLTTATGGDMVIGNNGSTGTVTVASNGLVDIADLTTIGANGTLTLGGGTFRTRHLTNTLGGTLDLDDGVLTIDGGSLTDNTAEFRIAESIVAGQADLELKNGATGVVGALNVGFLYNGGLLVEGGSTLTSNNAASLGRLAGSQGDAVIDGAGSRWDVTGEFRIGRSGIGVLTVQNGADVTATADTRLAMEPTGAGTLTVTGAGSTFTGVEFHIGEDNVGSLTVQNGGDVIANGSLVTIGHTSTATGTLLVTGSGSSFTTTTGDLVIGNNGSLGTVTVADDGLVDIADLTTIGANGRLNLQGGTFRTQNFTHNLGGTIDFLSGTLHVGNFDGDLTNQGGTLAPGQSPGITSFTGSYTQLGAAALEIEIGGLTPGSQHDQVIVTGSTSLGGRLEVPILDGYVPAVDDEITFLTAAEVSGAFDSLFSPNLSSVNPNVALKVTVNPTNATLSFVTPSTDIQFNAVDNTANWSDAGTWTDGSVPDTTNIITLQNLLGEAQRVNVDHENAFVHELSVVGNANTMTVAVPDGSNLSATVGTTVGNQAIIELGGGNLVSSTVAIEGGGLLAGNGTVVGDLAIGEAAGPQQAILSPGFSVGHLDVKGDFQQGPNGTLLIDVEGDSAGQFDTIDVTGEIQLGGTLRIDASQLTVPTPGATVDILTAGSILPGSMFDSVDTVGNEDIFFAPTYSPDIVLLTIHLEGDMNGNGVYDAGDIQQLALALTNPDAYFNTFFIEGTESGDIDDNGRLDFDDIDEFAALMAGSGATIDIIVAAIEAQLRQVPEPSAALLFACGSGIIVAHRRSRRPQPPGWSRKW